jgi:hypothetical protein
MNALLAEMPQRKWSCREPRNRARVDVVAAGDVAECFYSVRSERQLMEQLGYVGARTPDRESKAAREAASPERLTENARASGNSYLHGHRRVSGSRRQTEPFAAL